MTLSHLSTTLYAALITTVAYGELYSTIEHFDSLTHLLLRDRCHPICTVSYDSTPQAEIDWSSGMDARAAKSIDLSLRICGTFGSRFSQKSIADPHLLECLGSMG